MGCLFAYLSGSAAVFVEYFKLSPLQYSWLFGLNAVGIIGFSQLNRVLLRALTPAQIMTRVFPSGLFCKCDLKSDGSDSKEFLGSGLCTLGAFGLSGCDYAQ